MSNALVAAMHLEEQDRFKLGDEWLVALMVTTTARLTTLVLYRNRQSVAPDGFLEFSTADRAVSNIPVMRIVP